MADQPKFAVVLSGCGVYDGAEVYESVLSILAIERHGGVAEVLAPDVDQMHVINHHSGEEAVGETRNVKVEAARIARGPVKELKEFDPADYDVLLFPGGFGAAKNLSTFAVEGEACRVDPDVQKAIESMHKAGKPIGALCISPVLLGRVLPGVELTIGDNADVAGKLEQMGARHRTTTHAEVITDDANRVVTGPCYMLDATVPQIAEGAENVVKALLAMRGG